MRTLALSCLALLAAAAAGRGPERDLATVAAAARKALRELRLDEKELRTRHDAWSPDAWRLPLVDAWLGKPLAVPGEAWRRFGPWLEEREGLAARLVRAGRELGWTANGEARPGAAEDPAAELLALWPEGAPGRPERKDLARELAAVPRPARPFLARLLRAIAHAVRERRAAFARLSEEEWVHLRKYGSQFNTGMPVSMQAPLLRSHHARIDIERIYRASLPLAAVLEEVPELARDPGGKAGPFHLVFETPAGRVEIGGPGTDRYEEDALLVLDLGGDDVHANSAGGALYTPAKVSVTVDLGGDDVYRTEVGFAQGSGTYGIGMLVDAAGDDVYDTKNASQGAGHAGVGVLWDLAGDDRYAARAVSQGAGFQGIGLLRDDAGRDVYRVGLHGQGVGFAQGFGILLEGDGDDRYAAGGVKRDEPREPDRFLSMAQGFGQGIRAGDEGLAVSGGIGLLADLAGDDAYEADVFGQGAAYWYALGVLLDGGGRDFYEVHNYGMGAGFHMAVGVHVDVAGNDRYLGRAHALGHGLDRAVGFFADLRGDDLYDSQDGESQGAAVKPFAVGFFADLRGDDRYRGGGNGYVRVPDESTAGAWPKAVFLDLDGRDAYRTETDARDGTTWTRNRYGRGRDE